MLLDTHSLFPSAKDTPPHSHNTHLLILHVINQLMCGSTHSVQCGAGHITLASPQRLLHDTLTLSAAAV
jgi:hypothetical protein